MTDYTVEEEWPAGEWHWVGYYNTEAQAKAEAERYAKESTVPVKLRVVRCDWPERADGLRCGCASTVVATITGRGAR